MRKVSLFIGLALFALAGSARAQDEAPAPAGDTAAAPAGDTAAAPAGDTAAAPAPAPEAVKAAAAASDSKMQAGVSLLPMLLGKGKFDSQSYDLKMAYGIGLSFNYVVIPGLTVGIAPQLILNVKAKDGDGDASKQYDLMARVAYAYTVAPKFAIYAEVLPGYSIISPPHGDSGKGFVIAGGVGAMYDVTDQVFVNLGVGYQYGMQKTSGVKTSDSYLRIAVGAGVKF